MRINEEQGHGTAIEEKIKTRQLSGFTLVEMSIVLVIIALLTGGIFVGSSLIRTSQLRSVVSDIQKLVSATNEFQVKYGCIPGDCANATNFFPAAINGNGDEKLDGAWWNSLGACTTLNSGLYGPVDSSESYQYFYQLAQAGMIRGSYTGVHGTDTTVYGGWRDYV